MVNSAYARQGIELLQERRAELDELRRIALDAKPARLDTKLTKLGVPKNKVDDIWIKTYDYIELCKSHQPLAAGKQAKHFKQLKCETSNYLGLLRELPPEIIYGSLKKDRNRLPDEKLQDLVQLLEEIEDMSKWQLEEIKHRKNRLLSAKINPQSHPIFNRRWWVNALYEILRHGKQSWNFSGATFTERSGYAKLAKVIHALSTSIASQYRERNPRRLIMDTFKLKLPRKPRAL